MFYITIKNPSTDTHTKKDYKTMSGAEKAYNKACEGPKNFVSLYEYATGTEIYDTLVKSNYMM